MKNKTTCTELIRKELEQNFPENKFKVTTANYSITVSWIGGPAENKIDELLAKYQYAKFEDQDNICNDIENKCFTRYLFLHRKSLFI